jgi:hypothetical protein
MSRITTDDGHWFDSDKAQKWEEHTRWDGNNRFSLATRSQWNHEELYLTAGGRWVLSGWSQYQGSKPWCHAIEPSEAYGWLLRCEHDIPASLSDYDATAEL